MDISSGDGSLKSWLRTPKFEIRHRLKAHADLIARTSVSIALALLVAGLSWQLAGAFTTTPMRGTSVGAFALSPSPTLLAERIRSEHLFGDTSAANSSVAEVRAAVTVTGIAYAADESESVALLSVAGQPVVAPLGTRIATGETVSRILPDRIELSSSAGTTTLFLDVEQADSSQRMNQAFYASRGATDSSGLGAPPALSRSYGGSTTHVELSPTHFVSLHSLRGHSVKTRFQAIPVPRVASGKP